MCGDGVVGMGAVTLRSPAPALLSPHPHPPLPPGQTYYGQVLKKSADLQTNACATAARPVPKHIREALNNVHEEVALRYYGCGLVIPEHLENCWILDLGSGSGRDCYALSQLVGEMGHVTGIDMTEGQVEVAKKYIEYHMEKYGFQTPNVIFHRGYIEKLEETGIKNESYDIVISNCVINLVPDKQQVLQEVHRVLKHGGELYFSDVYASLELPEEIRTRRVLWGECLGGALYWKDLAILAQKIGFCRPRLVSANLITVQNEELERVIDDCRFVSATFRLFKLPKTGPAERCQVIYNGGITGHEKELIFDANFTFKEGEIVEVDEETAAILKNSRFAQDFLIKPIGEKLSTCRGCSALESKTVSQRLLTRCSMNGLEGIHEPLKIIGMYVYFSQESVYYFHQILKGVQIQKKIKSYLGKYYSNIQIFVSLHEIVKMPYRKTVPVYMPTSNA